MEYVRTANEKEREEWGLLGGSREIRKERDWGYVRRAWTRSRKL
ncbi:uncharacterized protein G2W53_002418 [Senna tora]|uniref:Uncharacterized protein n=1 Tax=Senna tora TaxID=362788 RepID=A0A834XHH4_9FABA|nr:uncharacterized protein G2W53_002418 [Senna tora]